MTDASRPNMPDAGLRVSVPPFGGHQNLARWAPIPLRLIVGYGFIAHGYAKIVRGPDVFVGVVHALGVPAPHVMGWATIVLEVICGFAVLVGALVPLASVPMVTILLVAMFTVHRPYGFTSIKLVAVTGGHPQFGPPGYECDLLYLACLAALLITGPGPWSIGALHERLRGIRPGQDSPTRPVRSGNSVHDSAMGKLPMLIISAALLGVVFAPADVADAQDTYRNIELDHAYISNREADRSGAPADLLLHGLACSSGAFEPTFAHVSNYHYLAAPGDCRFSHCDGPDPGAFGGTFEGIATVIQRFAEEACSSPCALCMRDRGGRAGFHLATVHPERVQAFLSQNPDV
jgi:putative oxidoreductase